MAWFNSSSSSSHHYAPSYYDHDPRPYFDDSDDDEGDIKPSVVEHWHRDYNPYGGPVEDVKPAKKQSRPPSGGAGGAVAGRRVHDDDGGIGTALSWPVPEQFLSTLRTPESIAGLRSTYTIPDNFALLPAGPNQPACSPPSAPRGGGGGRGASAAVPIPVYAQAFSAGMRLPLHPFVSSALTHYGFAPSQVARPLRLRGKGWYSFRGRESVPALFTGLPNSTKAWKEEFLLVAPPPGAPWRCPVRWGVPSKEAMSDPVLTEGEAVVARRLAQGHGVVDLKTYVSESNLVAAKISRAPACLGAGTETSRGQPAPEAKKRKAPATACIGTEAASRVQKPAPEAKKRKAPAAASAASASVGGVLRSELEAKEKALAQAKGKISIQQARAGAGQGQEEGARRGAPGTGVRAAARHPRAQGRRRGQQGRRQAPPWRAVIHPGAPHLLAEDLNLELTGLMSWLKVIRYVFSLK
ncbi:hypothetical protein QOZ80_2AG0110760 [Eleusine coracana subsp. coracana]|nr:hypothetical protein QOZ80_2AG0110760 [Eleusine coracana subsp. coracana]